MNHGGPSEAPAHQMVAPSQTRGAACLAVAVPAEDGNKVLLVEAPGENAIDGGFTLPIDRVLPGEGLLHTRYRVIATTIGSQVQDIAEYFGHHGGHRDDAGTLRTFLFGVTVVDPQDIYCTTIISHQWV